MSNGDASAGTAADRGVRQIHERHHARLTQATGRLNALSPLAVLGRGYSVTRNEENNVIVDAASLAEGDLLNTRFANGNAISRVESAGKDAASQPNASHSK